MSTVVQTMIQLLRKRLSGPTGQSQANVSCSHGEGSFIPQKSRVQLRQRCCWAEVNKLLTDAVDKGGVISEEDQSNKAGLKQIHACGTHSNRMGQSAMWSLAAQVFHP